jgi:hypothetical protein
MGNERLADKIETHYCYSDFIKKEMAFNCDDYNDTFVRPGSLCWTKC